jgi:hypothetical protein
MMIAVELEALDHEYVMLILRAIGADDETRSAFADATGARG